MTTTSWSAAQAELLARVEARAAEHGYALTRVEDGFDLQRDLTAETQAVHRADGEQIHSRDIRHEVRFTSGDRFTVVDVERSSSTDRHGHGPNRSWGGSRGKIAGGTSTTTYEWRDGWFRKVGETTGVDYAEGRELVEAQAAGLGLTQQRGASERIAVLFAIIGGVGAVITVVVLLVALALGKF